MKLFKMFGGSKERKEFIDDKKIKDISLLMMNIQNIRKPQRNNYQKKLVMYSQFTLKEEDRARSREVKEEREKRRKDLRLAQNFSMGLRSGEQGGKKTIFLLE